ncbi:ribosome recycling factor, partial [Paraburkholderia sp. SIMBA_055]
MINDIKKDAQERMGKSIEALSRNLAAIRTGRAHPSILDSVKVTAWGSEMPLNQVAAITVEDARTLKIVAH